MPKVILTDAAAHRYKAPPGARVNYFDASLPGFALRVSGPPKAKPGQPQSNAGGKKAWVYFYRHGGKLKMLTFEPGYPALGLADARQKAYEAQKALKAGDDPAQLRAEAAAATKERKRQTVAAVFDEFERRHLQGQKRSARYVAATRRNFERDVRPFWGERPIADITRRDVIELIDRIADRGAPIAGNRMVATLSKLFRWAVSRDLIPFSPVAEVAKPGRETKRERVLDDREIVLLWRATETLAYPFRQFFRLALATGQRRDEIARMTWDELDLADDEPLWTLAGARTKGGVPHSVPLSPLALRLIKECPQHGTHVLTIGRRRNAAAGAGDAPISGFSKAKTALDDKIAELAQKEGVDAPAPWVIHDLRRTCRTGLSSLGVQPVIAELVIGHRQQGIAAIYDLHRYDKEKRAALDAWSRHLEGLLSPIAGNVVPLRREI